MGIVYKLMTQNRRSEALQDVDHASDSLQDKKITADHILQLCKFLAEKSNRNSKRSLKKQRQQQRQKSLECAARVHLKLEEDADREPKSRKDTETDLKLNQEPAATESIRTEEATAALPLIKHNRLFANVSIARQTNQVLSSRHYRQQQQCVLPSAVSSSSQCSLQQGNKKDILQKIRNQILERKRQRHLASMQHLGGVWRPW